MKKRDYDYLHWIDGFPMLTSDVDVEIAYRDIEDNSGFDESGCYHRFMKAYNKRTWKFKYAVLTKEEFAYLRSLIKNKPDFKFSFVNEFDNSESVRAFCTPISVAYQSARSGLYKNLVLEITEC